MAVSFMKLEPAGELTAEEAELLDLVEPLRRDQRRRRAQMHADRLGWEERILAMEKGIVMLAKRGQAAEGITELERILTANPPTGVSAAEIADFFERQRPSLIEALLTILRQIHASLEQVFKINGLIFDGVPFNLTIENNGRKHLFAILPDVDGIEVMDENSVSTKFDAEDGPMLLNLMARARDSLQGGNLLAIEEDEAIEEDDDED